MPVPAPRGDCHPSTRGDCPHAAPCWHRKVAESDLEKVQDQEQLVCPHGGRELCGEQEGLRAVREECFLPCWGLQCSTSRSYTGLVWFSGRGPRMGTLSGLGHGWAMAARKSSSCGAICRCQGVLTLCLGRAHCHVSIAW